MHMHYPGRPPCTFRNTSGFPRLITVDHTARLTLAPANIITNCRSHQDHAQTP